MSESVGIALEDATDGDTCNGLKSGKSIADPTYPETDLCCYQTDQPYHDWCLPCLARKGAKRIAALEAERDEMMDQNAKLAEFVRWVFDVYVVGGHEEGLEIVPEMERLGIVSGREYKGDLFDDSGEFEDGDIVYFLKPWVEQ